MQRLIPGYLPGKGLCNVPLTNRASSLLSLRVVTIAGGLAVGLALSFLPGSAQAACGLNNCGGTTQISAITVYHNTSGETNVVPVEPDTGETFTVIAYWDAEEFAPLGCSCHQTATASVTVDVDWSDATGSWTATCTGCNGSGPIYGVTVCHVAGCGSGTSIDNAWAYELVVQIAKINTFCAVSPGFLSHVTYTTTSVDDGDTIRTSNCTELDPVSPTSQTFSVTDNGTFECTYTCAAASGPTVYITYE